MAASARALIYTLLPAWFSIHIFPLLCKLKLPVLLLITAWAPEWYSPKSPPDPNFRALAVDDPSANVATPEVAAIVIPLPTFNSPVAAPLKTGVVNVGEVRVLLVSVSVVVLATKVSVVVGSVTVTFPPYAEWAADCKAV